MQAEVDTEPIAEVSRPFYMVYSPERDSAGAQKYTENSTSPCSHLDGSHVRMSIPLFSFCGAKVS